MEQVLKETYGVMVYQEQVIRTVQTLANFTLGGADILRRAIGKKIPEEMAKQRQKFIDGCKENDIGESLANSIFDLIDNFAGYGFNKSHSAAYALIAYQTAWLKANYPVEFMAALLTIERSNSDNIVKLTSECQEMGIPVLPPDINDSDLIFTTKEGKIRFGLNAIKNVGSTALESILAARDQLGRFENLSDVFTHIDSSKVNSRVLEALIKSGVFDAIEPNRRKIFEGAERLISVATAAQAINRENQVSFLDLLSDEEAEKSRTEVTLPDVPDWKSKKRLKYEKETLGFYISGNPIKPFIKEITSFVSISRTSDIREDASNLQKSDSINLAGVITSKIIRLTKKSNEKYAMLTVEDLWGTIDVIVFSKVFAATEDILNQEDYDDPVFITGFLNRNDEAVKVVAQKITPLQKIREDNSSNVQIELPVDCKYDNLESIKDIIHHHPGECSVSLTIKSENNCKVLMQIKEQVRVCDEFVNELEGVIPLESVEFHYARELMSL